MYQGWGLEMYRLDGGITRSFYPRLIPTPLRSHFIFTLAPHSWHKRPYNTAWRNACER